MNDARARTGAVVFIVTVSTSPCISLRRKGRFSRTDQGAYAHLMMKRFTGKKGRSPLGQLFCSQL